MTLPYNFKPKGKTFEYKQHKYVVIDEVRAKVNGYWIDAVLYIQINTDLELKFVRDKHGFLKTFTYCP